MCKFSGIELKCSLLDRTATHPSSSKLEIQTVITGNVCVCGGGLGVGMLVRERVGGDRFWRREANLPLSS